MKSESETKDQSRRRREKLVVMGSLDGTEVEVDFCEVPIQSDQVFVLGMGMAKRQAVDIARIQRLQLVRGTV